MESQVNSPLEYIKTLNLERQEALILLRKTILEHLPAGFTEEMSYGMIGYVVPHSIYPAGYHSNPKLPLPFISIASQKSHIALYHMGLYANQELLDWFISEYEKQSKSKIDMGKSCIRFKKIEQIPYPLIAELVSKMTVKDWISIYESTVRS
jgi:uncharacterized protein YdhG (YjbR/CyaY superfamily)